MKVSSKLLWTFGFLALICLSITLVHAEPITTEIEQKYLIEQFSGEADLDITYPISRLNNRFTDNPEMIIAADFIKRRYLAIGIDVNVVEYNPEDVLEYHRKNTAETYRKYLLKYKPKYMRDFSEYCSSQEKNKLVEIENRISRVGLNPEIFCQESNSEQLYEIYLEATIEHTSRLTKKIIQSRTQSKWLNVVARIPIAHSANKCVFGAHFDSIHREGGGRGQVLLPVLEAPGADDNATGTFAVLTLARSLKKWVDSLSSQDRARINCDLEFVHFSGEEQGLFGSLSYAHNNEKIRWMMNFDMLGYDKEGESILNIGYDSETSRGFDQFFNDSTFGLKTVFVDKNVHLYSSDQISFSDMGIPTLVFSEQACADEKCDSPFNKFNPYIHTKNDKLAALNLEYFVRTIHFAFDGIKKVLLNGRSD